MEKKLKLTKWLADESGATAIEYALIASAMALALVPAMSALSTSLGGAFSRIVGYFTLI